MLWMNKYETSSLIIVRDMITLGVNHIFIWIRFIIFLDLLSFGYLDFQWRDRNFSGFIKNILICVSKINQSIT